MSLHIVSGRSGSGKSRFCFDEITAQIKDDPSGAPLILILPEHATFMAERRLAEMTGGYVRAYIFGFRRLAHQVLRAEGGALRPHISELGKKILLMRFLHQKQDELVKLGRAARQPNFADVMLSLVKEFRSYNIAPNMLTEAATHLAGTELGAKLSDIASLYGEYQTAMEEAYTDSGDALLLLAEKIPSAQLFRGARVWIDGFRWFNPLEVTVLRAMLTAGVDVTVTLCLGDTKSADRHDETDLFCRQWETRKMLLALAKECHVDVRETELGEQYRLTENEVGAYIEQHFFSHSAVPFGGDKDGLVVREAVSARQEAEMVACEIVRLCREEGYRYRDIAVLTRSDGYRDLLPKVFDRYDIPYFTEQKRRAIHHPLAELIRASLDAVRTWNYESVFRALKTEFFPLTREEIDRLENYVLRFGIRGSYWTQEEPWTFRRRMLLEEDREEDEENDYLAAINDSRMRVVLPLKKAKTVEAYITELYDFLEELEVPQKLSAWADEAEAGGDLAGAAEQMQVWKQTIALLEQLAEVGGSDAVRTRELSALIESGLAAMEFSLVPQGLDRISIGSMEQNNAENLPIIFLVGASDGVLPRRGGNEGLLNDDDRAKMLALGVDLAPGTAADALDEEFLAYQLLTRAAKRLYISYPLADSEGKGVQPSPLIVRLCRMTKTNVTLYRPPSAEMDDISCLAHPKQALGALGNVLRSQKRGEVLSPVWARIYEWARRNEDLRELLARSVAGLFHYNSALPLPQELAGRLYRRKGRLYGSVTRFERFRQCPFSHFARYGLKLKERDIFQLKPPDLGEFYHAALKVFGERTKEKDNWGAWSADECKTLAQDIVAELAPKLASEILLSNAQKRALLGRLERTIIKAAERLCRFGGHSSFRPYAYEEAFGFGEGSMPPLKWKLSDGTELAIVGQIDRIDSFARDGKRYFLVIDYKSGRVHLTMPEVYYGLRLQLLTYLMALESLETEGEEMVPAGVLYYYLKQPFITAQKRITAEEAMKEISKAQRMPGWLLKEKEVLERLDTTLSGSSTFICINLKKDGDFHKNSLPYLKTEREFDVLRRYTAQMLRQTGEDILDGYIAIRPVAYDGTDACAFCSYKAFCQFDETLAENQKTTFDKMSDEDALERMIAEGGAGYGVVGKTTGSN
ncbi:MAG: helicase-exonuclease AddAB subunit AddB [Selenomonadales bacterium]|nr:helicase-exonuclease AddAB subunit AddB [Selenomonadales bacterium]